MSHCQTSKPTPMKPAIPYTDHAAHHAAAGIRFGRTMASAWPDVHRGTAPAFLFAPLVSLLAARPSGKELSAFVTGFEDACLASQPSLGLSQQAQARPPSGKPAATPSSAPDRLDPHFVSEIIAAARAASTSLCPPGRHAEWDHLCGSLRRRLRKAAPARHRHQADRLLGMRLAGMLESPPSHRPMQALLQDAAAQLLYPMSMADPHRQRIQVKAFRQAVLAVLPPDGAGLAHTRFQDTPFEYRRLSRRALAAIGAALTQANAPPALRQAFISVIPEASRAPALADAASQPRRKPSPSRRA